MAYFSIIIPVYNRLNEVKDLLHSLSRQTDQNFEVVLVEDGSSEVCTDAVKEYEKELDIKYFYKENEGRSIARNYGLERATGEYFLFFDSDCVIPDNYISVLYESLQKNYVDCFGGPDAAHGSFTDIQKAINFSMTAFLTTGGIRGGKISLEKFVPRTFNMGFSRKVWEKVGGFREMFSEDIDMSTRIRQAGFSISLIREAYVFHKRRVNLQLFCRQIYVFGMSRITLYLLYPDSLKLVHWLPAVFLLGSVMLLILSILFTWTFILPLVFYFVALFINALIDTKSAKISFLSILTSMVQLFGYGYGFLKAYFLKIILRKGRNVEEEIRMRKGK